MNVLLGLLALFLVLMVLSWILVIPIAIVAFLIKIAPLVIVALIIYGLVSGRIEITIHRVHRK